MTVSIRISRLYCMFCNALTVGILRVMWSQGKARAERWTEEVALLLEEMRRTLSYCVWKANWWRARAASRTGSVWLVDGTYAYASKQAQMWTSLADSFADQWAPILRRYNLPADWPPLFQDRLPDTFHHSSAHHRQFYTRVKKGLHRHDRNEIFYRRSFFSMIGG